jgi:hypothetical protein
MDNWLVPELLKVIAALLVMLIGIVVYMWQRSQSKLDSIDLALHEKTTKICTDVAELKARVINLERRKWD